MTHENTEKTRENKEMTLATTNEQSLFIKPVASLGEMKERYKLMNDFVSSLMIDGKDYGTIPGTGTKPTLLKPGAEKLCTLFGLTVDLVLDKEIEDWSGKDHSGEPFFYYRYNAIMKRGEKIVATSQGSANSWEKKYRYRTADLICPVCGKNTIIKGKKEYGGGWLCYGKKGGCGAKWSDGDPEIESQPRGTIKNENPADIVNTLQKMAQKRAFVAGTIIAANASEYYTQDIEDMDFGIVNTAVEKGEVVEGVFSEKPEGEEKQEQKENKRPETQRKPAQRNVSKGQPKAINAEAEQIKALTRYRKRCYDYGISTDEGEAILQEDYDGDAVKALKFLEDTYGD